MTSSSNDNKLQFTTDDKSEKTLIFNLEQQKMRLGLLGKLFGSKETASTNIAGTVLLILVLTIPVLCFFPAKVAPLDYINIIVPIIGPIIGYFFGKDS